MVSLGPTRNITCKESMKWWIFPPAQSLLQHSSCTIPPAQSLLHHPSCTIHHAPSLLHHPYCTIPPAVSLLYNPSCTIPPPHKPQAASFLANKVIYTYRLCTTADSYSVSLECNKPTSLNFIHAFLSTLTPRCTYLEMLLHIPHIYK